MINDSRPCCVRFVDKNLFEAFKKLQSGKTEEKRLAENLERAVSDLKRDPFIGIKIPTRLWPKEYKRKYAITNLRKYNLPDAWRLVYTITGNEVEIISILLEWFNHKEYEKRFRYNVK